MNINHIIDMIKDVDNDTAESEENILDEIDSIMQSYTEIITGRNFRIPAPKNFSALMQ